MFLSYSKKLLVTLALFFALSPANVLAEAQTSSLAGSFSALGQTVNFNAAAPTDGGGLTGNFSGACTGTIDGDFNQETKAILGSINGHCDIVGFTQSFILNYSGSIDSQNRKLIITDISHIDGSSSIVTNFIQLPTSVDVDITNSVDQVQTGTIYTDPQNSNVKVIFNSLPGSPGSLSFGQAALTPSQIAQYHAINGSAFQLISSMADGTFDYDLTLPFTNGLNLSSLIIRYGVTLAQLDNIVTQGITDNGDGTFTIHGLNHFTYFVVTVVVPSPTVSFTAPVNSGNKNNVTITGSGLANGHISYTFTDNGSHTVSGIGTVGTDGSIFITGVDLSSLNDGTIDLSVTIDDGLGNFSDPGTSSSTKDTNLPVLSSVNVSTSNTNPLFAKAGDLISLLFSSSEQIQIPNVTIAGHSVSAINAGFNNWLATYIMALGDIEGFIPYIIDFVDINGNSGTTLAETSGITFDKTPPTYNVFSVVSTINTINVGNISIGGEAEPNVAVSLLFSDGISTVSRFGTVSSLGVIDVPSADLTSLLDGSLTLTVTFTDSARNTTVVIVPLTKDTVLPVTSSDNVIPGWFTSNPNITLSASDTETGLLDVRYSWDIPATIGFGTIFSDGTVISIPSEGIHTLYLFVIDNVGNIKTYSAVYQLDTIDPIVLASNSSSTWRNTIPSILVTGFDDISGSGVASILYGWDSTASILIISGADLFGTFPGDGIHTLNLLITDVSGRTSTFTGTYMVDTILPVISGVTLTNQTTGNNIYVKDGDIVSLSAMITDNNQALLTTAMITADLSSLGGGAAVHPISYDSLTGLATWAPFIVSASGNGIVTVTIDSLDIADNPAITQSVSAISDNIAPSTTDNTSSNWFNSSVTVILTCADTNGCAQTYYTTDGSTPDFTSPTGTSIIFNSNGIFTIKYFSVDLAGNIEPVITALNLVKVDIVRPSGSWINPVAGSALKNTINISFSSDDDFSGVFSAQTFYKLNNGMDIFHPLPSNWDTYPLELGNYTLRLVVTDVAGNVFTKDIHVNIIAVILSPSSKTVSFTAGKITWETNHPTTSRVVYDTVSHQLGIGPNHGYYASTAEMDESYTLLHMMMAEALSPYTTYYVRVISRINGGPDSVGEELSFRTFSVPDGLSSTAPSPVQPVKVQPKKDEGEIGLGISTAFAVEENIQSEEPSVSGEATGSAKSEEVEGKGRKPFNMDTVWAVLIALGIAAGYSFWIRKTTPL